MDFIFQCLLGVVWAISGALMTFNPPPRDVSHAATVPWTGAALMLGGICYVAYAVRERSRHGKPSRAVSRQARHGLKGQLDPAVGAFVGVIVLGICILWWGISTWQLSVIGLGSGFVGTTVVLSLNVIVVRVIGSPVYPQSPRRD